MTPAAVLERGLGELGIDLPLAARQNLWRYIEMLAKWNRTYNLTAIRDPLKMISHHLLDSLAVLPHLPAGTLADIGSGGGLPGVPLAVADASRRVTLNDSSQKKGAFLRQAAIELEMNAEIHVGRVEEWAPVQPFACVITRGFAELADFSASCAHLVAADGVMAAMKGVYPEAELASLPASTVVEQVIRLSVPGLDAERHLVLLRPGQAT